MTDPLITTHAVKQRTVWAAMRLLERAGCDVVKQDTSNGCTLNIVIPPDPHDIHGARLKAITDSAASNTPDIPSNTHDSA